MAFTILNRQYPLATDLFSSISFLFSTEFKRSVTPDVFKQMASLLKAYQEEVDSLTTRAKLGEAAFLEVFKQLYEAPDPAPAIAQGLVRI